MATPDNYKIGGLYVSDIDKGLYSSTSVWGTKVIGQLDKDIPFILLDSKNFIETSFLKVLTSDGSIGFIRIFRSWGETIKEFNK